MERNYLEEQRYLKAKKRVKDIKGFYGHLASYVGVNIFLTAIIVFGMMNDGKSFVDSITHFGAYSTWLFWGIGVFFHWLGVFGFGNVISKDWEERKIRELMEKDNRRDQKLLKK